MSSVITNFTVLLLSVVGVCAQGSIVGKWKSIDDQTGEAKSIVEIYEQDGKVFGRIISILKAPIDDPDPVCTKCAPDDPRYKQRIIGMEIIKNLRKNGNEYTDGTILDPEVGKVYRCKLWIEANDLKVRGYWGPLWRTQTWKRA